MKPSAAASSSASPAMERQENSNANDDADEECFSSDADQRMFQDLLMTASVRRRRPAVTFKQSLADLIQLSNLSHEDTLDLMYACSGDFELARTFIVDGVGACRDRMFTEYDDALLLPFVYRHYFKLAYSAPSMDPSYYEKKFSTFEQMRKVRGDPSIERRIQFLRLNIEALVRRWIKENQ